jgi:hypothetical protein
VNTRSPLLAPRQAGLRKEKIQKMSLKTLFYDLVWAKSDVYADNECQKYFPSWFAMNMIYGGLGALTMHMVLSNRSRNFRFFAA